MTTKETIQSQKKQKQKQNESISSDSFEQLNNSGFSDIEDHNSDALNQIKNLNFGKASQTIQTIQQQIQTQEQDTLIVKQLKKTIQQYNRKIIQYQKIIKQKQIQVCIQKQQKIKLHHQSNILNLKMIQMSKENKQLFEDSKEYIQKISCLKQTIQFQRDSYQQKLKMYKGLLEQACGFSIAKSQPQMIKKLLQIKNQKIRILVKTISQLSLKTIQIKQGKTPSIKQDLDEQIQKLEKVSEYCCKLQNQKTALKEYIIKLQNSLEQKSKDNKGFVEKFLQPIGIFYKKQSTQNKNQGSRKLQQKQ